MGDLLYLAPLFFVTAVVYSSAGFGGGSTYLAILALFGVSYALLPQVALVCNLTVVAGGLALYVRSAELPWRRSLPFVALSVPAAFMGGSIPLREPTFFALLGLTLLFAGSRLFWTSFAHRAEGNTGHRARGQASSPIVDRHAGTIVGLAIGGAIGFVAGLVGIGGGIFLSPVAYLLRWGSPRQIAALTTFFILVNSASGLAGQWTKSGFGGWTLELLVLPLAVFLGGQVGTRLAIRLYSPRQLQRVTAVVILAVAVRLLWGLV